MAYKVEQIPGLKSVLGEGPHWDDETKSLYFIDIITGKIHRYSYDEKKFYTAEIENEKHASFIIPVIGAPNRYAVGLKRRIAIIHWDGVSSQATIERIAFEVDNDDAYRLNHLNDGKADPKGHLITGTLRFDKDSTSKRLGSLYSASTNGKITKMRGNISLSNGIAFNEKSGKMYYVDSGDNNVREFNYDFEKGTILDEGRVVVDLNFDKKSTCPDGMTIDTEGFLYVAIFGMSRIVKVDPLKNKVVLTINFPCEQITSCAFGGPNHDILFATSANFSTEGTTSQPPEAGNIFKVTGLGAKGMPMNKVQL